MATVHLVDASPYIFRAYFSLPESLRAPDGRPVNAVRGFTSFLLELLEREAVTHAAIAFDESLTTSFRNELFPAYKAQRELPPEGLMAQLADCAAMARALGLFTVAGDRHEADDFIATLCRPLEREGHDVVVVSPDKDLSQLVAERVVVLDWAKGARSGPGETRSAAASGCSRLASRKSRSTGSWGRAASTSVPTRRRRPRSPSSPRRSPSVRSARAGS